ncbi:MAG: hypothetical protein NC402_03950 [Prevotella sp.]|nr:hypothetical protein [Prevotella sp.]MCM1074864.1 hypothetical protein [Ruminococcus sp.]
MKSFTSFLAVAAFSMMAAGAQAAVPVPQQSVKDYQPAKNSKALVKAAAEEEEETFVYKGKGTYRDNLVHTYWMVDSYPEYEVEIYESSKTPGLYRVMNPYLNYPKELIGSPGALKDKDYYITIDASDPKHVHIPESHTGFIIATGEELMVWSIANDYYDNKYGNWILADQEGWCGTLEDGAITFPVRSLPIYCHIIDSDEEEDKVWKLSNASGMFRVKLPGAPELDVKIEAPGINTDHTELTYELTWGKDIETVKAALVKGEYSDETAKAIIDGTIASETMQGDGPFTTPYTGDGIYTLYTIPYYEGTPRYQGTPREVAHLTYDIAFDESEWRKCGTATYHEAIVGSTEWTGSYFPWLEEEHDVEVEENVQTPGRIRLVNPYGPGYRYYAADQYDSSRNYYLVVNGGDSDGVFIEKVDHLGLSLGVDGFMIWSKAGRSLEEGKTKDQVMKEGTFGKYENNEYTFPKDALLVMFHAHEDAIYWGNHNGSFSVKFKPGQIIGGTAGVADVLTDSDATEQYYTINGIQLPSLDGAAPGVYIVKRGAKTSKIVKY